VILRGIFLFFLAGLCACTKPNSFHRENAQTVKVDDLPADFKMPARVWELIEKASDGKSEEKTETKSEGHGEAKSEGEAEGKAGARIDNLGIFYSAIQVFLTEKNDHILKTPASVIELPRGGGTVDLAQYLTGDPGSFFVGFELPEEFKEGKNFKVLYVSQARKRKIDDRVFGAGCNQYFDITAKFTEMMKTEGIKANTTRQRHVTLLAGHYIFSVIKDTQILITQVTITDSKNKNLLCEAL
jgi:hypothetical protein